MKSNKKMLSLLLFVGLNFFGMPAQIMVASEDDAGEQFPSWDPEEQLPSWMDRIYREPMRKVWHRIKDKQEERKHSGPNTVKFYEVPFDLGIGGTGGITPGEGNYFGFPNDEPYGYIAFGTMLGMINQVVAHERVHYAEGDNETISYHHAVFKEFRAEVKGLLLWQENEEEFNQILHGFYTVYKNTGPVACDDIHARSYETLLCSSLWQQHKEAHPDADSEKLDADFNKFIDHFVAYRTEYQEAAMETGFLGDFTRSYVASWANRAATILSSIPIGNKPILSRWSGRYPWLKKIDKYATQAEYGIGKRLCKLFNSRFVWDKDAFRRALDEDSVTVAKMVVQRLKMSEPEDVS